METTNKKKNKGLKVNGIAAIIILIVMLAGLFFSFKSLYFDVAKSSYEKSLLVDKENKKKMEVLIKLDLIEAFSESFFIRGKSADCENDIHIMYNTGQANLEKIENFILKHEHKCYDREEKKWEKKHIDNVIDDIRNIKYFFEDSIKRCNHNHKSDFYNMFDQFENYVRFNYREDKLLGAKAEEVSDSPYYGILIKANSICSDCNDTSKVLFKDKNLNKDISILKESINNYTPTAPTNNVFWAVLSGSMISLISILLGGKTKDDKILIIYIFDFVLTLLKIKNS